MPVPRTVAVPLARLHARPAVRNAPGCLEIPPCPRLCRPHGRCRRPRNRDRVFWRGTGWGSKLCGCRGCTARDCAVRAHGRSRQLRSARAPARPRCDAARGPQHAAPSTPSHPPVPRAYARMRSCYLQALYPSLAEAKDHVEAETRKSSELDGGGEQNVAHDQAPASAPLAVRRVIIFGGLVIALNRALLTSGLEVATAYLLETRYGWTEQVSGLGADEGINRRSQSTASSVLWTPHRPLLDARRCRASAPCPCAMSGHRNCDRLHVPASLAAQDSAPRFFGAHATAYLDPHLCVLRHRCVRMFLLQPACSHSGVLWLPARGSPLLCCCGCVVARLGALSTR